MIWLAVASAQEPAPPAPPRVVVCYDCGVQRPVDLVWFDAGSATIADRSVVVVDEAARVLLDNPGVTIRVVGHADARSERRRAVKLARARAEAVVAALVERGVAPERLSVGSWGGERPLAPPPDERNRRVEFEVLTLE